MENRKCYLKSGWNKGMASGLFGVREKLCLTCWWENQGWVNSEEGVSWIGSEFSDGEKDKHFDNVQPFAHLKLLPLLPLFSQICQSFWALG